MQCIIIMQNITYNNELFFIIQLAINRRQYEFLRKTK